MTKIKFDLDADNKDDIMAAIDGLSIFTHNFCMNCKETEKANDLIFNCENCNFASGRDCLVKCFAYDHLPEGKELPSYFGSMGPLQRKEV